ncbi:tripartite tricarboxylate transporter permease [Marinobacter hydrocarbonoclasticus]|nr:tripartite tricarboxylate transporter permease [Marinobacter nauticus]
MARGSIIGTIVGALPGSGATIASFLSYGVEKRVSKDSSRFGKGAIEGVKEFEGFYPVTADIPKRG